MILHGTLNNYDINIKKGHQIDDKIGYLRSTVSLQNQRLWAILMYIMFAAIRLSTDYKRYLDVWWSHVTWIHIFLLYLKTMYNYAIL